MSAYILDHLSLEDKANFQVEFIENVIVVLEEKECVNQRFMINELSALAE